MYPLIYSEDSHAYFGNLEEKGKKNQFRIEFVRKTITIQLSTKLKKNFISKKK